MIALYDTKVEFEDFYVFGELSLDGKIKDSSNIFPIVLSLTKQKLIKNVLVCKESAKKLSKIPNINIYCVDNLDMAMQFFKLNNKLKFKFESEDFNYKKLIVDNISYFL